MSALTFTEKRSLEEFLGMGGGYVLDFSDRTLGEFVSDTVSADIHSECYASNGTSKANKLRTFWKMEPDYRVGKLLQAFLDYDAFRATPQKEERALHRTKCQEIAARLVAGGPRL